MATTAKNGVWDISPVRREEADKENDIPVLSLIQFSKAPFVSFGAVKLGTSKSAVLRIENPNEDVEAVVIVEKIASNKGFSVDYSTFTIEAEGSLSLTITWTPVEEGGVRELIIFNANGVVKHQAVLLGRAEAPKRKKKTLWDSIKNKPAMGKVSGPRVKRAEPTLKMSANKTFQVSRKPQYKRDKPRSPLASLNKEKPKRERSLSQKNPNDKQTLFLVPTAQDDICNMQENSPFVCRVPETTIKPRNSQEFLSLPENKDLTKILNKTLSPIGTPDGLKKLMPQIDPVESPLCRAPINTEIPLNNTPTLSIKEALALIDSDLSPINSSPQSCSEFSDSLESKSSKFKAKINPETPAIDEPRLTFLVGKKVLLQEVKVFTSTTVTKPKAPVEANPLSGRKIKKSRRRLLEKTLELSDSSSQGESRSGTPCLPVIDTEANGQNSNVNVTVQLDKGVEDEQRAGKHEVYTPPTSPSPIVFLVTSPQSEGHHVSCAKSPSQEQPVSVSFTPAPSKETTQVIQSTGDIMPVVSMQPPVFFASSPELFPIHVAGKGQKRKSEEFLMVNSNAKAEGAGKSERIKRSRVLTVKCEPSKERRTAVQRQQPKPAGSVRAVSSLKAVKSAAPVHQKAPGTKPSTRRAPSVKLSAQKSKIVAVAQSKLTFIQPTQTAIPRHPMPFAAKNMFFDERWIEKQERGFTWWINYVLTPDDFKVNTESTKVSALSVAMGSEVIVPKAPTKEEMSFSTYTARRKLNRLRRSACLLFSSEPMVKAIQRLELEVEARRLLVRKDRHLWKDIGERQKVLNWLLSYNPLWLRIGLETIFGELISLENNGDTLGLAMFILQRLLWNPDIAAEFRHAKVPHLYRDGHEEALSRFTLKKLLLLVCFLDKAKESRLIEHDPCLFCMDAEFKTSKDLLLAFSRDFLSGEGILPRHLGYLGLPVSHEQKPLDEFNFAVKNLAVDLKCGIRLVRVMELLVQDWSLSLKLRLPAISRLQKVHNVDLALQLLKKKGVDLKDERGSVIDSRDIVDGHREKTLALLWKIMFAFHVEVILNEDQLKEEICFLRKTLKTKRRLAYLRTDRGLQPSPAKDGTLFEHSSPKIRLLMDWVRAVCSFYTVKVENFTVSFSDGRVLCYLIHHYHPGLVPESSICQSTTQTVESSPRGRLQLDCSNSDSDCSFDSAPSSAANDSPFKELLENEKNNFRLVNSAVSFLGGVPAMINVADMSNTIPNEKVVMSYLSFLCTRLLDLRNETRAARVIQAAWRKYRLTKDLQLYQERNTAALKIQSLVRKFLQRRRAVRQSHAATVIQSVWRGYVARQELRRQKRAQLWLLQTRAATVIQANWRMFYAMKSYQRLGYHTIVIQAQWRMRRAVSAYRNTLWAVSVIQTYTRAWSMAKRERVSFLSLRAATVTIQRAYRLRKSRKMERENHAAKVIQGAFRKWHEKKMSEKVAAAVKIQAWYRMQVCLHQYRKIKVSAVLIQAQYRGYMQRQRFQVLKRQHYSATVIQSAFRGYIVRKQIAKMAMAAVVIQQHFRSMVKRNADRQEFLMMKNAAVTLQAAYRGKLVRDFLKTQHKAATIIQTAFRKYAAQKRYSLMKKSTILIQQKYRATRMAIKMKDSYLALRNATVKIQATWRGRKVRKRLDKENRCATIIQAWFHRYVAQKQYKATKASTLVIQQHFRRYMAMKTTRKAFLDIRTATISLQAAYRGMMIRKEIKKKRRAATIIQSCVKMILQRKRYRLIQSAAIVIQSRYRALIVGRKQQHDYRRLKEAALRIQAIFRGKLVRRELKRQQDAATAIQAHFRMYQVRMAFLATKCAAIIIQERYRAKRLRDRQVEKFRSMKTAAVTIQAAYRGYKTRKQIYEMRKAAIVIQRALATHRARNQFVTLKKAAIVCQRRFRAVKMARNQRCDYLTMRKSVICLQSAWRGHLIRKELRKKHTAATIIQSHFRKYKQQVRYNKLKWAAKVFQDHFRANRKMNKEMLALKVKRNAAVVIQAAFRGMLARRLMKKQTEAAVVIQRAFKTYCQRKWFLAMKLAAVIIQERYRASVAAKKERAQYLQMRNAAVFVQALYRGHQVRKEVARWNHAATVIQSAFRKKREEVKYQAMRLSVIIIQRYYRSWLVKKRNRAIFMQTRQSVIVLQSYFRGYQVRKSVAKMHQAATLIQAHFKRYKQQSRFERQRWAACILQKRFRAQRRMRLDAQSYQQQKKAIIVLQAAYRGLKARQSVKNMHKAASVVQLAYKTYCQRKQYLALKNAVVTIQKRYRATVEAKKQKQEFQRMREAAVAIQAAYRGLKVRKEVFKSHRAATVIQSAFRKYKEQVKYQAMRLSAIIIQRYYRSWVLQKQERNKFLKLKHSAILIQAVFRGHCARKDIAKMQKAATIIQANFRMHKRRTDFKRQQRAACVLQQRFRAQKQMNCDLLRYQRQKRASVVIQAAYRGMKSRQQVKRMHRAACVIQRSYKTHCERKWYQALKNSTLTIQRRYRATIVAKRQMQCYQRKRRAAVLLQAVFRGHRARKELANRTKAALVIQSNFRRYREEMKYQALRLAAVIIQRRYRALVTQQQQRSKFIHYKRSAVILQAAFRGHKARQRLSRMHRAATVIQANFRKHKEESVFKKQRWAACLIQQKFRAQRRMKFEMDNYQKQKEAVVVLQAAYRGLKARQSVKRMHKAASVVQLTYKTYCQRKKYLALKAAVVAIQKRYRATVAAKKQKQEFERMREAALFIQAAYRGLKVRKEVCQSHHAATVIQSAFRRHKHEVVYQAVRLSAVIIQRYYRSWVLQRKDRSAFLKIKRATIVLQAAYRGWQVRRNLTRQNEAAVAIQSQWKCFVQRRHFQRTKEAVLKLQSRVRAVQLAKRQRDDYNRQRQAAMTLQRHWRSWIIRKQELEAAQAERRLRFTAAVYHHLQAIKIQRALRVHWALVSAKKQIHSVITIQRWVRVCLQRRRYRDDRRKVVLVQRAVKRWFDRRQKAARVIQQAARKLLLLRRQKRVHQGIVKAQALWRGYRSRCLNDNAKVVKLRQRLKKVTAGVREEDKLCNKTSTALDYLLRYKHFSYILEALKNLETATRLSPECCERLVESGATKVIFTLIRCCNRSVPCMEVITYSIQILLNLSKYHETIEAVYSVESSVDTLLELLQRYREKAGDKVAEKGGSIFTKACFLLALLLQDKRHALEVTKIPKAIDRLQSIYRLTARKHKMDADRTVTKQKMNASINGSFYIQATPRKTRPTPKFAPEWVLTKNKLKDIVDPLRAIQIVAETLSIIL
ncbi:abnormal spindle-like microcephaly-associated protein [Periophthalmus magnuspinnatus]|uniref:abnormal spindle-like microcephaly-associated protein n=1 Tax=Periophthalmus magnuspinnatus TaxID=409849 RepID=UPI0024365CB4|nr:abnormal spindle-like microcephaly-associated protein [Periophthalmus magnuspinnatus]